MDEKLYITIEKQDVDDLQANLQSQLKEQIERFNSMTERAIELRASLDMIDWIKQQNIYTREYKIKN